MNHSSSQSTYCYGKNVPSSRHQFPSAHSVHYKELNVFTCSRRARRVTRKRPAWITITHVMPFSVTAGICMNIPQNTKMSCGSLFNQLFQSLIEYCILWCQILERRGGRLAWIGKERRRKGVWSGSHFFSFFFLVARRIYLARQPLSVHDPKPWRKSWIYQHYHWLSALTRSHSMTAW